MKASKRRSPSAQRRCTRWMPYKGECGRPARYEIYDGRQALCKQCHGKFLKHGFALFDPGDGQTAQQRWEFQQRLAAEVPELDLCQKVRKVEIPPRADRPPVIGEKYVNALSAATVTYARAAWGGTCLIDKHGFVEELFETPPLELPFVYRPAPK